MGLESQFISSDTSHLDELTCSLCKKVTSLDSYVTNECAHPFCRQCFEPWLESKDSKGPCDCPSCGKTIKEDPGSKNGSHSSLYFRGHHVAVRPMSQCQPLAHRVLKKVKVLCPLSSKRSCSWTGDYCDLKSHMVSHRGKPSPIVTKGTEIVVMSPTRTPLTKYSGGKDADNSNSKQKPEANTDGKDPKRSRNSVAGKSFRSQRERRRSLSQGMDSENKTGDKNGDKGTANSEKNGIRTNGEKNGSKPHAQHHRASSRGQSREPSIERNGRNMQPLAKHLNGGDKSPRPQSAFTRSQQKQGSSSSRRRSSIREQVLFPERELRRARSLHDIGDEKKCRTSSGSDLKGQLLDALKASRKRTISPLSRTSGIGQPASRKRPDGSATQTKQDPSRRPQDHETPTNTSEDKAQDTDKSPDPDKPQDSGNPQDQDKPHEDNGNDGKLRDRTEERENPENDDRSSEPQKNHEKKKSSEHSHSRKSSKSIFLTFGYSFKERANASFKAARYEEATTLYTEALSTFHSTGINDEDDLASTIYSNRAATYLRRNQYDKCIRDCDSALQLRQNLMKAHLRKSWALIELGKLEDARLCLKTGLDHNPQAKELESELHLVEDLLDHLGAVSKRLGAQDYEGALEAVQLIGHYKSNIRVKLAAAQIELGLGNANEVLKHVQKILNNHPAHVEALRARAQAYFLNANFDAALADIKAAIRHEPSSSEANASMRKHMSVQKAVLDARKAVLARHFTKAVALYSGAVEGSKPISTNTPLYRLLYSERGEANLGLQDFEAVLVDTELALGSKSDYTVAWITRVRAFQSLKRYPQIREELEPVIQVVGATCDFLRNAYEEAKSRRPHLEKENSFALRIDYYGLFGVKFDATAEEIRRQYRLRAKECHPDRFMSKKYTEMERKAAEEKFKTLGEGLEILCDPFQRKLYDSGADIDSIRHHGNAAERRASNTSYGRGDTT